LAFGWHLAFGIWLAQTIDLSASNPTLTAKLYARYTTVTPTYQPPLG
jgi:hypothetical protein